MSVLPRHGSLDLECAASDTRILDSQFSYMGGADEGGNGVFLDCTIVIRNGKHEKGKPGEMESGQERKDVVGRRPLASRK